jgi:HAD superfamily hydrolase (TIGR01484 family)
MKYRAAFFDIDGVLKEYSPQEAPKEFEKEAIEGISLLKDRGIITGYASGKCVDYLEGCAKISGIYDERDIFIGENGGVIKFSGSKRIYDKHMEEIRKAREKLERNRIGRDIYLVRINGLYIPLREEEKESSITLLFSPEIERQCKNFRKELKGYFDGLDGLDFVFGESYVDINQKGCNKGYAIKNICEELGLDSGEIIAVGDGINDIPMLEIVGFPACPSNSKDDVKKIVTKRKGYVAKNPVGKGTREICEYVLRN